MDGAKTDRLDIVEGKDDMKELTIEATPENVDKVVEFIDGMHRNTAAESGNKLP